MERTTIPVDLAKSVFEVAVANERGQIFERKRLGRASFRRLLATRPSSRVVTTRLAIYLRDGLAYVYCGDSLEAGADLTLDHVTPHTRGGSNDPSNLVTACRRCNSTRQDRSVRDFASSVASYLLGDADAIVRCVHNAQRRQLDRATAREMIARRCDA